MKKFLVSLRLRIDLKREAEYHYKILNSCEITPKTGAGDGAV